MVTANMVLMTSGNGAEKKWFGEKVKSVPFCHGSMH
jgi:hypothetical protein